MEKSHKSNWTMFIVCTVLMAIVCTLAVPHAIAKNNSAVVNKVISVYDGDTFNVDINGWPPVVGVDMPIRINGIDTPEINGKCMAERQMAQAAKKVAYSLLAGAKLVQLRNLKRDSFFRIVADVYADGVNVGDYLLKRGYAVPYDGKKKTHSWCQKQPQQETVTL